ncbi:hypothetical protein ABD87_22945 [Lysinibacillus sphaericus]|uniref:hypothetical protein n=1 Tax=Lysinibacillus sphaericus TaxID=1421 RepID=UPI0018CDD44E|nr:hypothetical protein [Lysinibacillus sphaericus]MBG9732286.1 hypothetical protein [Lysinibacillus sphaericus]
MDILTKVVAWLFTTINNVLSKPISFGGLNTTIRWLLMDLFIISMVLTWIKKSFKTVIILSIIFGLYLLYNYLSTSGLLKEWIVTN